MTPFPDDMDILDIHTHQPYANPLQAIQSCTPLHFNPVPDAYYSVGFHPWHLVEDGFYDWDKFVHYASHPQVLAIGEVGLDKLATAKMSFQSQCFEKQIEIASDLHKPLIIHCVKAYNEMIRYKMQAEPGEAWIIHGFRGKAELAAQLIGHGFYLSFGERYQEEAIRSIPLNRLFLETDDSKVDIHTLYERAALCLAVDVQELKAVVGKNIRNVFFNS
ncbi:TatD family hydrolase [Bacteroides sp. OttesenSCG-928-J23]|nr:TatD family hydrolase [Bacteroides sp. OttesenSCG-928-J23]MDL2306168.1 TatD family hydrolase [Bacteroides sp. OttesenSCG-928-D19]